ncbi:MAG: hypothetical protein M1326_06815 [Cyanobacteria bacterium]|nr:hypothetical protein [Cyanobacteriota bacterium]
MKNINKIKKFEKKYKNLIILSFVIILFFILSLISCDIIKSGNDKIVTNSTISQDNINKTDTSFDLTKELNSLKDKMVNPPIITSHKPYQQLTSGNDREMIILRGKADVNSKIQLKVNGRASDKRYDVDSNGDFEITDGIEIVEGINTIEVYAINSNGDKSEPTKLTFLLNVQKNLDYKVYDSIDNLIEIKDTYYSKSFEPKVYIHGIALPSVNIYLKVNDKISGQSLASDKGEFSFKDVQLLNGDNTISIWYVSSDGQPSVQVNKNILVYKDVSSPDPSSLTGFVGSDGNHLSWTPSTDSQFISYKIVRVEDPAKNPRYPTDNVIATITDKNVSKFIDTNIISGKAYFYTLWTMDKAGNLISSNVLPLPAPEYTISIKRLPGLQSNILARREWYYEYYEITNTGNVPVNIQPVLIWFILDPQSDSEMALNPLWAVYIWDPGTGNYYYSNEDIRQTYIADWNNPGTTQKTENVTYSADGLTKTTTVTEVYKIANDSNGKRILTTNTTTTITITNLSTGESTTTTTHDTSSSIVEPEKVGTLITGIQPGEKIKIAVKITNIGADNGDKITVHFNFAPADSFGYFFTDDMVSTNDINVTSSGK